MMEESEKPLLENIPTIRQLKKDIVGYQAHFFKYDLF